MEYPDRSFRGSQKRRSLHPAAARATVSLIEQLESRRLLAAEPLISEFLAQNNANIVDQDGEHSDWLEIYNPNPSPLSLNGYYLSDNRSLLTKWKLPNVTVGARDYLLVWASNKNRTNPASELHTNFALSKDGEYLGLTRPDGTTIVSEFAPTFPAQTSDISYGIPLTSSPFISATAAAKYLIPQSGSLGTTWTSETYDDSGWTSGVNGVGYDTSGALNSAINSDVEDVMHNQQTSAYVRIPFDVADPALLDALTLQIRYNDGFVAYLNGTQVARKNAPSNSQWNSTANAAGLDAAPLQDFDISNYLSLLHAGTNVLAVHGLNQSKGDADFLIQPQLTGVNARIAAPGFLTPTPAAINRASTIGFVSDTSFDHDRGMYSSPFDLVISTDTPGASIRYTLDGSAPTPTSGTVYAGPVPISSTTVVRAIAYKTGLTPTNVDTQTYIFPGDVAHQPKTIAGYPNPSLLANKSDTVPLDYEMDPEIISNPAYKDKIVDALQSIPSLSVGVKRDDIFDNGFYDTDDVEFPISMEFIDPNHPEDNVQINAGIESHAESRVKRALRINFKKIYGVSKLSADIFNHAPVGGDSATSEFDSLILRSGNNRSWATTFAPTKTTYTEDEFVRQNQLAMSDAGVHGTFVHLYINGLYWGLYNLVERPDEGFGEAYYGGDQDNYFAISHNGVNNGDPARWNYMANTLTTRDMSNSANYAEMQSYLDVQEYADYLLSQFYAGVTDWPFNNWWAGGRTDTKMPFRYFTWDSEFQFNTVNVYPDPPNGAWVHPSFREGDTSSNQVLVKLWRALKKSDEFMTMFADRAFKAVANNGALTDANSLARLDALNSFISDAVIAESARWGDSLQTLGRPTRTRDGDWKPATKAIRDLIPGNAARLIAALREQGYYPSINPATMSQQGGLIPSGYKLGLTNSNGSGTIYYTTDGSDPRNPGGGVRSSAKLYDGTKITLSSNTRVRLRIKNGSEWSALNEANFTINTIANLRFSEVMYHPKAPANALFEEDEYEFIELKNTGGSTLNLNGLKLGGGIDFTFGNVNLAAGEHVLVVENLAAFKSLYGDGLNVAGQYSGKLANSGDHLTLATAGNVILADFSYADTWYPSTDGGGFSLVVIDPTDDPESLNQASAWRSGEVLFGTPGADEPAATNQKPTVNAGTDQTINFPVAANLAGIITDDDKPAGVALTSLWSKVSGPGNVTFGDATKATTTATFAVAGVYVLRLTASDSLLTGFDEVTITVNGQTPSFAVKINFQPANAPVPSGYAADSGLVYGGRGNGLTYGWNTSRTEFTRDRNAASSPDQRYDTLIHTANGTWEISVPNGTYNVHVVSGDANYTNSVYKVSVENVLAVNGAPTASQHWVEGNVTVTVSDGRLTLKNAAGADNNKLNYIEITSAAPPPPAFSAKVNFQPDGVALPSGYLSDAGQLFAARGGGLSYGWNKSNGQTRDRNSSLSQDQRYDTLIHVPTGYFWEIAVPNGTYSVHLVAGDSNYTNSLFKFNLENSLFLNGTPGSSRHWIEATANITVTDGRLTITNAAGSNNNKLNYVDIKRVS